MESSVKKFTPYKKILLCNEVSHQDNPSRKRIMQQPEESDVSSPKSKKTIELQASCSRDPDSKSKIRKSQSEEVFMKKKRDRSKKLSSKESKSRSKNNKENNTIEDVVIVEDSNDAISANSIQLDDHVIVLDANANVKLPSTSCSPTVSCNLDTLRTHIHSPTENFNSFSPGWSTSISDKISNIRKDFLQSSTESTSSSKVKKIKKDRCIGSNKLKFSDYSHLDKLFANANVLPTGPSKVVDTTLEQNRTPSTQSSILFTAPVSKTIIECIDNPNLSVTNTKLNSSHINTPHSSKYWDSANSTITLDDTIIIKESQDTGSDVLIINEQSGSHSKPAIGHFKQDESIIIDLELLPTQSEIKQRNERGSEPLIVYEKSEESVLTNTSNSLAEWPSLAATSSSTTSSFFPLLSKKSNKSSAKPKRLSKQDKRRIKTTTPLSNIEMRKLKDIRKTILNDLEKIDQFSQSGASTSAQNGPFSVPWTGFNQPGNIPFFIDTNRNSSLPRAPTFVSGKTAPAPRAKVDDNNIYNAASATGKKTGLRPIIIDGSNVAIEFLKYTDPSPNLKFNAKGIQIMVDYFKRRGHKEIHVFIPTYRAHHPNTLFPEILEKLKNEGILHHTPSRRVEGRLQCAYDDRYIVQVACELDGVIVSNDRYRDLMEENAKWKSTIEQRLLLFNFVGELLIFPQDPLGRNGPNLDTFLSF